MAPLGVGTTTTGSSLTVNCTGYPRTRHLDTADLRCREEDSRIVPPGIRESVTVTDGYRLEVLPMVPTSSDSCYKCYTYVSNVTGLSGVVQRNKVVR